MMRKEEYPLLRRFLYEAVFQENNADPLPYEVIEDPAIKIYIEAFGRENDTCFVAVIENQIVGCVWIRCFDDKQRGYGYVDSNTPELSISILSEYRGRGIGTALMNKMLIFLKTSGYHKVSLSVGKRNPAQTLYQRLGFEIIENRTSDYVMLLEFA